ncbi:hypothetical protein [Bradyrhizobium sp. 141]|uniref:hypothetical protein n=1 Tax=Bradyrhizobium sp. 141 TaxID=2782617 RepID=UPI001FFA2C50|nr:hypothetical protein [Bradyrhizobium sp. 141]MCK1718881.1 hypothetical protein [Bradyrhizobium sp. 141]
MARYRTIKPEFWSSEQVMECSPIARLMFIGLWNFADDAGRYSYSPKTIKAQVFPGDDITTEAIRGMVGELSENGLVRPYTVDGKEYLLITGWHHQKIDKPQKPRHPAPPPEDSPNVSRMVATEREKEREREETAGAVSTTTKPYAFEDGVIKLNQRDFDAWAKAFSNLDLAAELMSLSKWAESEGKNWFHAVKGALAKRNREVKAVREKPAQPELTSWSGIPGVV